MKITDRIQLGKRQTDSNGFVSVPAVITKVGIQKYHVDELRRDRNLIPSLRGKIGLINVFRPLETVSSPLTIDSFKNLPVTVQHPDSSVDTKTARFVTSGHVGSEVDMIDAERLGTTIYLHDEDAINISFGSETSAGYDCPVIAESGEYKGEKYDFRFDGAMIGNHLALVPAGRCGDDVGVLDTKMEIEEMEAKEIKELVATQVADALAKADIGKQVSDAVAGVDIGKQVTDAIAVADKAKADAAEEKAKTDAQSDQAKTDAAKLMQDRVTLHTKLTAILDKDYDNTKTDKELLVLAVGDTVEDAESKTDEYLIEKVTELADARKSAAPVLDSNDVEGKIKLRAF